VKCPSEFETIFGAPGIEITIVLILKAVHAARKECEGIVYFSTIPEIIPEIKNLSKLTSPNSVTKFSSQSLNHQALLQGWFVRGWSQVHGIYRMQKRSKISRNTGQAVIVYAGQTCMANYSEYLKTFN
jgi:hypothetical protein